MMHLVERIQNILSLLYGPDMCRFEEPFTQRTACLHIIGNFAHDGNYIFTIQQTTTIVELLKGHKRRSSYNANRKYTFLLFNFLFRRRAIDSTFTFIYYLLLLYLFQMNY